MQISKNLIKSMQQSPAWLALADAIDAVFAAAVEPTLARLKARPRLFEMSETDVKTLFDELGTVATVGKSSVADRPLLLLQRHEEMHFKNTLYPLQQSLHREFLSVRVSWAPLLAPTNVARYPYGSVLARQADIANYPDIPAGEWFRTSRGVLQVNLSDLYRLYPKLVGTDVMNRFVAETNQLIKPLLPTRIVYDGQVLVLQVYADDDAVETIQVNNRHVAITMASMVPDLRYRFGQHRIGSVRIGIPYQFKEPHFYHQIHINAQFGHIYDMVPVRFGLDRIGEARIGTNRLPIDTRFKSISRTVS